jgi:hypothetical protein
VVRARYVAERSEIAVRYREWEINRVPGVRQPIGGAFNPWRGGSRQTWRDAPEATVSELPLAANSGHPLLSRQFPVSGRSLEVDDTGMREREIGGEPGGDPPPGSTP